LKAVERNRGPTSTSTPPICLDSRIGNRRFELPIKVGDQAIQRAALFLTQAAHQINDDWCEERDLIYLVADAFDCLCESVHDAKKFDDRGKVRIEWVLVLGR
jgi:hypothetical protein